MLVVEIVLLKPKDLIEKTVTLTLSERTAKLLQFYSEYCKRNQDDVVDHYLEEIFRLDQKFQGWGTSKRNNKLFMKLISEITSINNFDSELEELFENDSEDQLQTEVDNG